MIMKHAEPFTALTALAVGEAEVQYLWKSNHSSLAIEAPKKPRLLSLNARSSIHSSEREHYSTPFIHMPF